MGELAQHHAGGGGGWRQRLQLGLRAVRARPLSMPGHAPDTTVRDDGVVARAFSHWARQGRRASGAVHDNHVVARLLSTQTTMRADMLRHDNMVHLTSLAAPLKAMCPEAAPASHGAVALAAHSRAPRRACTSWVWAPTLSPCTPSPFTACLRRARLACCATSAWHVEARGCPTLAVATCFNKGIASRVCVPGMPGPQTGLCVETPPLSRRRSTCHTLTGVECHVRRLARDDKAILDDRCRRAACGARHEERASARRPECPLRCCRAACGACHEERDMSRWCAVSIVGVRRDPVRTCQAPPFREHGLWPPPMSVRSVLMQVKMVVSVHRQCASLTCLHARHKHFQSVASHHHPRMSLVCFAQRTCFNYCAPRWSPGSRALGRGTVWLVCGGLRAASAPTLPPFLGTPRTRVVSASVPGMTEPQTGVCVETPSLSRRRGTCHTLTGIGSQIAREMRPRDVAWRATTRRRLARDHKASRDLDDIVCRWRRAACGARHEERAPRKAPVDPACNLPGLGLHRSVLVPVKGGVGMRRRCASLTRLHARHKGFWGIASNLDSCGAHECRFSAPLWQDASRSASPAVFGNWRVV